MGHKQTDNTHVHAHTDTQMHAPGEEDVVMEDAEVLSCFLYLWTHLSPRVRLNLGELELGVVGVHLADLLTRRGTQDLSRDTDGQRYKEGREERMRKID